MKEIDKNSLRELELYVENTSEIYHYHTMPAIENLKKKYAKGTYNREKACKLWGYVADAAAKMYAKEFCDKATPWYAVFPVAERRECAKHLERVYFEEYIQNAI